MMAMLSIREYDGCFTTKAKRIISPFDNVAKLASFVVQKTRVYGMFRHGMS
ncbi:MAG: hypothetical protein ACON4G_02600 [Candidatus Puniceispirillaceae bacterium]